MSIEKMREEFEAWYPNGCGVAGLAGKLAAKQAWEAAWQASRAALVIDLPQEDGMDGHLWAPDVVAAIEAEGVKVKP